MKRSFALLAALVLMTACSKGSLPQEKKRDFEFFKPMVNSGEDFDRASQKMGDLKVLASDQKYDMRFALFDNGKFYYEVANLGTGTGTWKFRDGFLNLFAQRSFFNVDIDLSAAAAEGQALEMRFFDRFGKNAVSVNYQAPSTKPMRKLALPARETL